MQKQRKFELLKDFGASKKGDIFTGPINLGYFYGYKDNSEEKIFFTEQVENNPEYFKEIIEKKELEWHIDEDDDKGIIYTRGYKRYKNRDHHKAYIDLMRHIEEIGNIEFGSFVIYIWNDFRTSRFNTHTNSFSCIANLESGKILPNNATKKQIDKRIELLKNFLSFYK